MNIKLKNIIAFSKNKEKNIVPLKDGLNIITGRSQTGKSALIEIVDYCLASSQCTIPKGVIDKSVILYAIVLEIENTYLILARRPFLYDKEQNGKYRMFINTENKNTFDIEKLTYNYFEEKHTCFRQIDKDVKPTIEKYFNFHALRKVEINENDTDKEKPTIRNIASFLFQHQNLISNKFALFYRFDNINKKKGTIEEFPIFTGIVDQDYYNLIQEKSNLESNLKIIQRRIKDIIEDTNFIKETIEEDLKEYYLLLGKEFDENILADKDIKNILLNIPDFDDSKYINDKYVLKTVELENSIKELDSDLQKIDNELLNITLNISSGQSYQNSIIKLSERIPDNIKNRNDSCRCPFCNSETHEIHDNLLKLELAEEKLKNELQFIDLETTHRLNLLKLDLDNQKNELLLQRKEYLRQKNVLKNKSKMIQQRENINSVIQNKKGRIEDRINRFNNSDLINSKRAEEKTIEEISILNDKIDGYNINVKLKNAEYIIQSFMNKIVARLDFEETFRPIDLKFDLKTFNLYQQMPKEKIFLSSMGSGANWLACHIGLFLGFHYYFAKMGKKCSVPSFLFLDQPSQIYFPEKYNVNKPIDIEKVEMVYNVLDYAIKEIKKDTDIDLQIIVMDHADGLELVEANFNEKVVRRWKNENDGFIKKENTCDEF